MYLDFDKAMPIPEGGKVGNAHKTIDYLANGEATDYMASIGVFAYSPELSAATVKG
jgi:hypothetical protein